MFKTTIMIKRRIRTFSFVIYSVSKYFGRHAGKAKSIFSYECYNMAHNYIQNMRTCHFIAIKLFSQILSHNLFIVVLGKCFYMPYKWYLGTFYSCHVLTTKEKNEKNFFVLRINDTNVYIFSLMRMIISNILGITIDFYRAIAVVFMYNSYVLHSIF